VNLSKPPEKPALVTNKHQAEFSAAGFANKS
jgi:hypothetical protein